ncbi:integrase_H2C2 domain-containing protein [Trichonephila inaurata madagascariensis]|uniref:Integrase_H2C2 domain-containing protein n=1 Tax=Trichonephila inaurata madagascariensis TaxID=2747483 RepID=A0A8X6KNJ3_9ARAC|nr:integrase_H2C2 domain-containing protein [Trichonephila inaurata madagascariensis]
MKNSNEQRFLFSKSLQSNTFQDERLLAKMQAFKDEDGLLRIRTKLADSYEEEDFKFPILLPASDVIMKLIREEHVKAMHAGSSTWLREKFWIIRAKRLVKQVLSECVICKRYKAKHVQVPFAPLPRDRQRYFNNCETPDLDQVDRSSLIKRTKYLREDLRQRFRNEYLALLVHRGTRRNDALEVGDVVLIGHDNVRRIEWPLGVVLEVYPGKDGVLDVLKAPGKASLPVEKTPESSTDHVSDSPTDYALVESIDNSEEKPPTKTRLGRTIKIPRKLDL